MSYSGWRLFDGDWDLHVMAWCGMCLGTRIGAVGVGVELTGKAMGGDGLADADGAFVCSLSRHAEEIVRANYLHGSRRSEKGHAYVDA